MASITPRKDKNGNVVSYVIRVYHGYDSGGKRLKPFTTTYKPEKDMSPKRIEKELNRRALQFEEQCKQGYILDNRQTFAQYADYVIELKERSGVKHNTIYSYRKLAERVNQGIGHFKLNDIRPQHLNELYSQLAKSGLREKTGKATAKPDLAARIKERGYTHKRLSELAEISENTLANALHGKNIAENKALAIAKALNESTDVLFDITRNTQPLSNKTILEHHRFISVVLAQAEKELLIPYNPAAKATPPKVEQKEANYFEVEDIKRIRDCLDLEPIKWRAAVHLLLITGARRGEILGLKWDNVDWKNNQIYICNNLLYSPDIGIYETTPKTANSRRYVKLPEQTMELLREYRRWQLEQQRIYGDKWQNTSFVFTQENGAPMNPTSLTGYCTDFSKRYGLPHINPHAFRHTMVSVLYFNGVDSISISRRLGHSKVSTTTDKYGHIMRKADEAAANCIADVIFDDETDKRQSRIS
ncbi:MAG: tyrosine-type recombinase/integrase [Oscillospiraceae bacterium]|nr:tyrosine-type recombinase/integrase [Oscillospiraceae bacterium]